MLGALIPPAFGLGDGTRSSCPPNPAGFAACRRTPISARRLVITGCAAKIGPPPPNRTAQAVGADDIALRFGFVGLAAFDDLRKAGARHAAEIAPGHDHEVRVERPFSVDRRPELSDHLRNRDTAAAGAGFRWKRLVFD